MQEKAKRKRMISSILISICSTFGLMLTSRSNLNFINTACLWGLGCIYLALGWYFLFWKYDMVQIAKIRKTSGRCMIFIFSLSVLAAAALCILLPFKQSAVRENNYYEKELLGSQMLAIRTLGKKNEQSAGYQVWLEGITCDGRYYNMYEIPLPQGWEFRDDRPYTQQQAETELAIPISAEHDYTVMIRRGPNAGKVEAAIGGRAAVYDLYAQEEEQRAELDLKKILLKDYHPDINPAEKLIYYTAYLLILWLAAFTCSIRITFFFRKEKHLKEAGQHPGTL